MQLTSRTMRTFKRGHRFSVRWYVCAYVCVSLSFQCPSGCVCVHVFVCLTPVPLGDHSYASSVPAALHASVVVVSVSVGTCVPPFVFLVCLFVLSCVSVCLSCASVCFVVCASICLLCVPLLFLVCTSFCLSCISVYLLCVPLFVCCVRLCLFC
jgi:hypothetical protein